MDHREGLSVVVARVVVVKVWIGPLLGLGLGLGHREIDRLGNERAHQREATTCGPYTGCTTTLI